MSESLSRLAHDLRGPALTVQGFAAELRLAADELTRAVDDDASGATGPGELARRVAGIVTDDLEPCIECIASAATALAARIDGLDGPAPDASAAA